MSKSTPKPATAAQVRAYFAADPKRVESLPEGSRKCLGATARGRLHPDVIKAFNAKRPIAARYSTGVSNDAKEAAKAQRVALREQARAAGFTVTNKGPLPKAFLQSLPKK